MSGLTLGALYRYPVKSLGGEAFEALEVLARGLAYDRHWMVVDQQGEFLSQRKLPRMSLIAASVDAAGILRLNTPGMPELALSACAGGPLDVVVWGDSVRAEAAGPRADGWLSRFLGVPCRLVCFAQDSVRRVDPAFSRATDQVGFADGFPFLLISQASLDDLNRRLAHPVAMLRFRPNLVVAGCEAFAEDGWRRIRVGELEFRVAKPCSRCIIPTIDPSTGQRGVEPLRTLNSYRRRGNKVYFGQNLVHESAGRLAVGMPVEVLE